MSNRYRNPFKIRATEKLESENNFLRMYSPYVLDELIEKNKHGKLWSNILFIRSSPGAGKTSILKIFEPSSLTTLANNKSTPDYKEIIDYLKKLDVIDVSGNVSLIGVYMSCARNYEVIEDLDISDGQKKSLFFALINARVILSSLRSIINLNNGVELTDLSLTASSFDYSFLDIQFPISGEHLFEWAARIEKSVFNAIDSFLPITNSLQGHSELFAFSLMQPSNFVIKGKKTADKVLFMFDDAHKLSKAQRRFFLDYLTVKRADYNIWVAERLEALDEQRNFGSYKDRDYDEINLEEIWQGASSKLKAIVGNIADKRASISSEDVTSFQAYLEDNIKESEYEDKLIKASSSAVQSINSIAGFGHKFDNWVAYLEEQSKFLTPLQFAVLSRQVEILVHRSVGKTQLSFEFPLTVEELKQKLGGEIQSTALYFLSIEYKIPFYYGFDDLVKLSSNNIEQFLSFAGELYESMLARKISDKPINIDAGEQEKILKRIADNKWKEQIRLLPHSERVMKFLQNLASFSQKETNKPNAPYAPGVSGFAIKEPVENKLIETGPWRDDSSYEPLISVLRTCLAYNLLEKRVTKQGKENQQWTVFYLNRWICLRFNLPFSYGGFRHRTPAELLKWTK
jgi:hypothetical protein